MDYMNGPFGPNEYAAVAANPEDFDSVDTAATVVRYWCWSKDERCKCTLLQLPMHPHYANEVAEMCVRGGAMDVLDITLLAKYARCVQAARMCVRQLVVRMCINATRFLPSHVDVALQIISTVSRDLGAAVEYFGAYLWCISDVYPLATRVLAAQLAADSPASGDNRRYAISAHVVDLTRLAPHSDPALCMLTEVDIMDNEVPALRLAGELLRSRPSDTGLDMLAEIGSEWPDAAIDLGVLVPLRMHDMRIPDAMLSVLATDVPRNEQHLLAYLMVYGSVPSSACRLFSNVLQCFAVETRVVYALEISPRLDELAWPEALAAFDESYAGCTVFTARDETEVRILTAHVRRHCQYFRCDQADTSQFRAAECTTDDLLAFRDLLYYDRVPDSRDLEHLGRVATLADLLCDTRHTCMCVSRLARQDYWLAYDLAKGWPAVRPWLIDSAHVQLERLVRCSRIVEIADMVAGVL